MKNLSISIFSLILVVTSASLLSSCGTGQQNNSEATTELEAAEASQVAAAQFVCPMHPDETGVEGDKCSKCGMNLEAVKAEASCPMHPEITGKVGDTCSKCKMDLVATTDSDDSDGHQH